MAPSVDMLPLPFFFTSSSFFKRHS
jgi:hypothetical protein